MTIWPTERERERERDLALGKSKLFPDTVPRPVDWIHERIVVPWFIGRFKGEPWNRLRSYFGREASLERVTEERSWNPEVRNDWKRRRERERERGLERGTDRWNRLRGKANYLLGASCHWTWWSFDRGKLSFRRLSGYVRI